MPQLALAVETSVIVEVSPRELVVVGGGVLDRYSLDGCTWELRDARCSHRFVRHLELDTLDGRIDLITPPEIGAIAPRAARLPEMNEPTAVIAGELMVVLVEWLGNRRRLIGHTVLELALLSRLASTSYAIAIGERAADLITQMTWERGSPLRSSAVSGDHQLLAPFEIQATISDRANLALMAALARAGRAD